MKSLREKVMFEYYNAITYAWNHYCFDHQEELSSFTPYLIKWFLIDIIDEIED